METVLLYLRTSSHLGLGSGRQTRVIRHAHNAFRPASHPPGPCFFTMSQKGLLSYLVLPFFQPLKNLNFFWAPADPLISLS